MSSPGSALSEYSSDEFTDVKLENQQPGAEDENYIPEHDSESGRRPSKRPRLTGFTRRANSEPPQPAIPEDTYLSSDTDGSVPASPNHPHFADDDEFGQHQVTVCKWEGCTAGDLGNMDELVNHLHDVHILSRQKKYSCEWTDCSRKGISHASGYALRAHMRSHTREKPFYCFLPECDRSFTRSDALAKHMRTVHETEALRPSDPVPKHHSSNPSNRAQRLRLVIGKGGIATSAVDKQGTPLPSSPSQTTGTQSADDYAHNNMVYVVNQASPTGPPVRQFPSDIHFTDHELSLPAPELYRLLRRQLHWAQQEAEELKVQSEELEKKRRLEWSEKEMLFENVMESELGRFVRIRERSKDRLFEGLREGLEEDLAPSRKLEVPGPMPEWRAAPPPPQPIIQLSKEVEKINDVEMGEAGDNAEVSQDKTKEGKA